MPSLADKTRVPIELTPRNLAEYLGRHCTVTELGGGVSNTVLLAESACERVVVKQSLAKLRVEQDWFSERDRIFREATALRMLSSVTAPGSLPRVLREDRDNYAYIMTAAPQDAR